MPVLGPDGQPYSSGFDVDPGSPPPGGLGTIVNETDLSDGQVQSAVETYFEDHATLAGQPTTFQMYGNQTGSLLARSDYKTPANVFDEIALARDLAEKDDDIGATIGAMIALAFGEGMQHSHGDEVTVALFDEVAKHAKLDGVLKDMYREYLISGQINTVTLFTRQKFSFIPQGTERYRTREVVAPRMGVLPAENVRVLGNDIFGNADLAWLPSDANLEQWLRERFDKRTSPARLAEMRREDPVAFQMFVEEITVPFGMMDDELAGMVVYRMNPRLVSRTTMSKGAWKYPRPLLTRNFPLVEAKRLLNIMDYALLQGGANFLVVAKKGTDQRPAISGEVENLREVVRRASRTGVIVGDHRLDIQIITPDLKELLAPDKRRLLGRKLAMALLRLPEHMTESAGAEGMKAEVELLTRVIGSDRRDVRRHVEATVYDETAKRNTASFMQGPAKLWFPKIILQGTQYFTDFILKMRDRGDISRRAAVEAGGFDYRDQVEQRRREKEAGDDEVMTPGEVPFSSPGAGPQDNNPGRPPGSNDKPGGQPASKPKRTIRQTPGETIRAMYEESVGKVVRIGDLTQAIMEEYAETLSYGRITALERMAVEQGKTNQKGPVIVVSVDPDTDVNELQAVRLDGEGRSWNTTLIVGRRSFDGAAITKAVAFRSPYWDIKEAEDLVTKWGFKVALKQPEPSPDDNS